MSIPQNAIPITIEGHPYLVEIDEFGAQSQVGAGRIIDIADETHPKRALEPAPRGPPAGELRRAEQNDPGASNPVAGLRRATTATCRRGSIPTIVACSMILSGLRVFDIHDPAHPREIAYFNAPVTPRDHPAGRSEPAAEQLGDVEPVVRAGARTRSGTRDGLSGFYAVRLTNKAARIADGSAAEASGSRRCLARRSPIGPRNIGRECGSGFTRKRLRALPRPAGARRRGAAFRYCVKGSSGGVGGVFSRRGRVAVVVTTARAHGNRGVRAGLAGAALRARLPAAGADRARPLPGRTRTARG